MRSHVKKTVLAIFIVLAVSFTLATLFNALKTKETTSIRTFQHIENGDADPSVGPKTIRSDGIVDPETFETHLPLFVLDTYGKEPPDIYRQQDDESRIYAFDLVER